MFVDVLCVVCVCVCCVVFVVVCCVGGGDGGDGGGSGGDGGGDGDGDGDGDGGHENAIFSVSANDAPNFCTSRPVNPSTWKCRGQTTLPSRRASRR